MKTVTARCAPSQVRRRISRKAAQAGGRRRNLFPPRRVPACAITAAGGGHGDRPALRRVREARGPGGRAVRRPRPVGGPRRQQAPARGAPRMWPWTPSTACSRTCTRCAPAWCPRSAPLTTPAPRGLMSRCAGCGVINDDHLAAVRRGARLGSRGAGRRAAHGDRDGLLEAQRKAEGRRGTVTGDSESRRARPSDP